MIPLQAMAEKIAPCKFCGSSILWIEYGKPPVDPTTKKQHLCKNKSTTTATASDSSSSISGANSAMTPAQQKERNQFDVIIDWMNLTHSELIALKHDIELTVMYNRVTMRALKFLMDEMEKKEVITKQPPNVVKEIFIEPIEEMEERLRKRNAERTTANQNPNTVH